MATPSVVSDVSIKKISNGYVLSWSEPQGDLWSFVEYYALSLEDVTQRLKTLFQGT